MSMTVLTLLALSCTGSYSADDSSTSGQGNQGGTVRALLTGYQEVPAVSSQGIGQFSAQLSDDKTKINFKLQWKNLEGATIAKADLHFGQFSVNGDVVAPLCGTGATLATCGDPASGSIEGSIGAADILGPKVQGIDPAETTVLAEVLKAIIGGNTTSTSIPTNFPMARSVARHSSGV